MDPQFMTAIEQTLHEILVWIGFGTLAGLAGKAIMPGRDPGGTIATLMMGIAGSIIGCGVLTFFQPEMQITPISLFGFVAATAGTFVILLMYRLLSGSIFPEAVDGEKIIHNTIRRKRARKLAS